jgi:predicted kinase
VELAILIGLQASGKTTFRRLYFGATHVLVSKDAMPNVRNRSRRQEEMIRGALAAGRSVVVDNTNLKRVDRAALIALGHEYSATVNGYWFPRELKDCLDRNERRAGKGKVPRVVIVVAARKLEPPTLAEGYSALYQVRFGTDQAFDIEPVKE